VLPKFQNTTFDINSKMITINNVSYLSYPIHKRGDYAFLFFAECRDMVIHQLLELEHKEESKWRAVITKAIRQAFYSNDLPPALRKEVKDLRKKHVNLLASYKAETRKIEGQLFRSFPHVREILQDKATNQLLSWLSLNSEHKAKFTNLIQLHGAIENTKDCLESWSKKRSVVEKFLGSYLAKKDDRNFIKRLVGNKGAIKWLVEVILYLKKLPGILIIYQNRRWRDDKRYYSFGDKKPGACIVYNVGEAPKFLIASGEKPGDYERAQKEIKQLYRRRGGHAFFLSGYIESTLTNLSKYLALKTNGIDYITNSDGRIGTTEDKIAEVWKNLKRKLQDKHNRITIEDSRTVKILERRYANNDWHSMYRLSVSFLQRMHPLDIKKLIQLIKATKQHEETMDGQAIILFLGKTGTGKSTTVHFLAGSKMVATKVYGLDHIAPQGTRKGLSKNTALEQVGVSPHAKSETRYVRAVPIELENFCEYEGGSVILCDTPGFEDTGGPEINIANGRGLIEAIKKCKNVRLLLLISYLDIGDKSQGIKAALHKLAGRITDVETYSTTFSYAFTKIPANKKTQIFPILIEMYKSLSNEEKEDTAFMCLLRDMLKKAKKGDVLMLDPLNDDPGEVLEKLMGSDKISYPQEAFKSFISPASEYVITKQLQRHQQNIVSAIKRKDYDLIASKLNELFELNVYLQRHEIEETYKNCIATLKEWLTIFYKHTHESFFKCLMSDNALGIHDIVEYKKKVALIENIIESLKKHLQKDSIMKQQIQNHLFDAAANLLVDVTDCAREESVLIRLNKAQLMALHFQTPEIIGVSYKNACHSIKEQLLNAVEKYETTLTELFFVDTKNRKKEKISADRGILIENLSKILHAKKALGNHLDKKWIQEKYEALFLFYKKSVQTFCKTACNAISKNPLLSTEVVNSLDAYRLVVKTLSEKTFPKIIFGRKAVIVIREVLKDALEQPSYSYEIDAQKYIAKCGVGIKKCFQGNVKNVSERENQFVRIKKIIDQMVVLRKNEKIKKLSNKIFFQSVEQVLRQANDLVRDVEKKVDAFFREKDDGLKYRAIAREIKLLKSFGWLDQLESFQQSSHNHIVNKLNEKLVRYTQKLADCLREPKDDANDINMLEKSIKFANKINSMHAICESLSDVQKNLQLAMQSLHEKIRYALSVFAETFDFYRKNNQHAVKHIFERVGAPKIDATLQYLEKLKAHETIFSLITASDIPEEINRHIHKIRKTVEDYAVYLTNNMENCYTFIFSPEKTNTKKIIQSGKTLALQMKKIISLKQKFSTRIFSHFIAHENIVDKWKEKLSEKQEELADEMARFKAMEKLQALSNRVLITKALKPLDHLIFGNGDETYSMLYGKYSNIYDVVRNIEAAVSARIKSNDFDIAEKMSSVKNLTDNPNAERAYKRMQGVLSRVLLEYNQKNKFDAITLGGEKDEEMFIKLHHIVNGRHEIENILFQLEEHINGATKKKVNKAAETINDLMTTCLQKQIDKIKISLKYKKYSNFEQKLNFVLRMMEFYGKYGDESIKKEFAVFQIKNGEAIKQAIKQSSNLNSIGSLEFFKKKQAGSNIQPGFKRAWTDMGTLLLDQLETQANEIKALKHQLVVSQDRLTFFIEQKNVILKEKKVPLPELEYRRQNALLQPQSTSKTSFFVSDKKLISSVDREAEYVFLDEHTQIAAAIEENYMLNERTQEIKALEAQQQIMDNHLVDRERKDMLEGLEKNERKDAKRVRQAKKDVVNTHATLKKQTHDAVIKTSSSKDALFSAAVDGSDQTSTSPRRVNVK
jgi:hypothetical protein